MDDDAEGLSCREAARVIRQWMPLYVPDYRADTGHLSTFQHGIYLLLIMHYWQTGSLPDDDAQLARIAGCTASEWKKNREVIAKFFLPGWKHGRIEKELAKAREISGKRRDTALQMHAERRANAGAIAQQVPTHTHLQPQIPKSFKSLGEASVNPRHGWSPPKHGATGRGRTYIRADSPEWEAYAADYRGVHGKDPEPNEYGGKWFKTTGEATH